MENYIYLRKKRPITFIFNPSHFSIMLMQVKLKQNRFYNKYNADSVNWTKSSTISDDDFLVKPIIEYNFLTKQMEINQITGLR